MHANTPPREEGTEEAGGRLVIFGEEREDFSLAELVQRELFSPPEGGDGVPEPYPEQVLPLPLVPVASHFSGGDTPREGIATPVQFLDDPAKPLNWEATGKRPKGETDKGFLVVDFLSPPQGSPACRSGKVRNLTGLVLPGGMTREEWTRRMKHNA